MIKQQSKPFAFPSSVFFIGIGGIEVSALAKLALYEGARVAGTDLLESGITRELRNFGAEVTIAKTIESISLLAYKPKLIIYSLAVSPEHQLLRQAKKLRIKTLKTNEALGEISKIRYTVAVSGMHGKSTTTSMIGVMLESACLDPLVIVGTKVPQWSGNIRIKKHQVRNKKLPNNDIFVLEADEYRSKMLALHPDIIVLTRVEEDHLDYYKNLAHIKREFRKYVRGLEERGVVIANWEDKNIRDILSRLSDSTVRYNYRDLKIAQKIKKILKVPGKHNVQNALAAYAVGARLGLSEKQILKGLARFKGTWRRLELVGYYKLQTTNYKLPIISDYAHHPTEIRASLQALREKYPKKRLVLAYQPHQHNRTKMLFNQFIESFETADVLILNEIFDVAGREEKNDQNVSSAQLANAIKKRREWGRKPIYYSKNLQETRKKIKTLAHKNDVLIIMGAGDIDMIARELVVQKTV
ncbi:MAG: UDP-N-acetylmuramate--L-alanine ligase [Candidatus Jacksonbacteria bacterium RIFOXYA2_FULL_44_7]|nr:MAG: UDP-N-acetylmuramate--L-alanine ligase [Candidatus Jacksonbacteria bacterium RIFOXYA2_FULL_44_7]